MLKTTIVDPTNGQALKINGERQTEVVVHPHPPKGELEQAVPFRQYFTDTGDASGSNDMRVNGSSTPVSFHINAEQEKDIYIKLINIVIADSGAALNKFGNISALSNGIRFHWESQKIGEVEIHEGLKTNFDFVRLAGGNPAFGSGNSSFKANNVSGSSEAFFMSLDLSDIFGPPWGIRLRKGTNNAICWTVRDNVSNIDQFDIIGYGIRF